MDSKLKNWVESKNLSKKQIIEILAGIILVIGVIFALMPKGLNGTYELSKNYVVGKDTDTIVFSGKNYRETVTTVDTGLFGGSESKEVKRYSGTYKVTDREVIFSGDFPHSATAKLSKDKRVLTLQDGDQYVKRD